MNQMVEIVLSSLLTTLPQIIIATAGLILAHTRLKRIHPRAYLYGNIGFALLLANAVWNVLTRVYIQAYISQAQDRVAFSSKITLAGLAGYVILTSSLAFILVAVLADRGTVSSSRSAA